MGLICIDVLITYNGYRITPLRSPLIAPSMNLVIVLPFTTAVVYVMFYYYEGKLLRSTVVEEFGFILMNEQEYLI